MLRATQTLARAVSRAAGAAGNPARAAGAAVATRGFASDADLKKTPLWDMHVAAGGKMVDFAGWSMPIQYKDSMIDSTMHCRTKASLFDVAHMCPMELKGPDAIKFLEGLVVADIKGIADGTGSLSVMTNEKGGIIDDTVITKINDQHIYFVTNAGCRDKDIAHISKHLEEFKAKGGAVDWHVFDEDSLLALQGPKAAGILQGMVKEDLSKLYFSHSVDMDIAGIPCLVTRTGYTGEDGFEIKVSDSKAVELAETLLANEDCILAGLGARDALRLEAGLCLYGNDLNEDITPVEAALTWTVSKGRREKYDFLGGDVIKAQIENPKSVKVRRVGILSTGPPARAGAKLLSPDGEEVGEMTSGAFSPNLKKNVGMGYVKKSHAKAGTELQVIVRGKSNPGQTAKMPFVETTYFKG